MINWSLMIIIVIALAVAVIWWIQNSHKTAALGTQLDFMDDAVFERYLAMLFARMGYQIRRVNYAGSVRTLVATKNGISYVIQARRNNNRVGAKAIEEVVESRKYYKCERAIVVTNHYFSKRALQEARHNQVVTLDRHHLIKELARLNAKQLQPQNTIDTSHDNLS